jgi:hypothetical protein
MLLNKQSATTKQDVSAVSSNIMDLAVCSLTTAHVFQFVLKKMSNDHIRVAVVGNVEMQESLPSLEL